MTPTIDWLAVAPALAPAAGALLVLVVDALLPARRRVPLALGVAALVAGTVVAIAQLLGWRPGLTVCLPAPDGACLWTVSPATSALQVGALAAALAALLLQADRTVTTPREVGADPAVAAALVLVSTSGAVAVTAARDLGTWLVTLELATLPLVALVALRGDRRAGHGALSLLLTSLLSFALLVLGSALWLTATGSPALHADTVSVAWSTPDSRAVLVLSVLVLLAGLGFKLSAVPFHAWTPQVFSAGPVPATALLAATSKVAALGALVVVLQPFAEVVTRDPAPVSLRVGLAALAVASMLVGTVVALRQDDILRLVAWSTIAQGGWVLLPLVALSANGFASGAVYLLVYAAAVVTVLGCAAAVRGHAIGPAGASRPGEPTTPGGPDAEADLTAYTGLLRTRPWVAGPLSLALLVLAGLPPGVIGLVAKVAALRPLVAAGWWPLAVVAVVAAVLGIAVYARWIAVLLAPTGWSERPDPRTAAGPVRAGRGAVVTIVLGTTVLVVLSVLPQLLLRVL